MGLQLKKLKMISIATSAVLASACFASASAFFFDPSSRVFTGTALSLNGGNALALSSGTAATAYLTSAGIGVAALGILGLALVKRDPPLRIWLRSTTTLKTLPLWMLMTVENCLSANWKPSPLKNDPSKNN